MSTQKNFKLSTQMARQRWRQLNQPYERQHIRGVSTESVLTEVNNSDSVHGSQEDTSIFYNLPPLPPVVRIPDLEQSAQPASEPAIGRSDNYCYITDSYYYLPQGNTPSTQVYTDFDQCPILRGRSRSRQGSDLPLAGSSHWRDNLGMGSTLQFLSPLPGSAGIQPQPFRTQVNLSSHGHDQIMGSNYGNHAQNAAAAAAAAAAAYYPVNTCSDHQVNRMVSGSRLQAGGTISYGHGTLNFNRVPPRRSYLESDTGFLSTWGGLPGSNGVALPSQSSSQPSSTSLGTDNADQIPSSVYGPGSRGNNIVDNLASYRNFIPRNSGYLDAALCNTSTPVNMSNGTGGGLVGTSENTNANMAQGRQSEEKSKDAKLGTKRRVGRPCGSSSANKGHGPKRAAPTSTEVNIHQIQIGQWQRTSGTGRITLSAKCYFKRRKLLWEILYGDTILKRKVVIDWKSIESMESIPELFQLKLKLSKPPSFFRETINKAKIHSSWKPCEDFTDGEALRDWVVHTLVFQPALYEKYMKILRNVKELRDLLNKGMRPEEKNVAMHFTHLPSSSDSVRSSAETSANTQAGENAQMYNMPMNDARVWNSFGDPMSSNQVPYDVPLIQVNEPAQSEFMAPAQHFGSKNDPSGMTFQMTDSLGTDSLLPEMENPEDALPESPSASWDYIDVSEYLK